MRRVSLEMVRPGMILARAILGSTGQVLLKTGVEIKPQYISYLKGLGVNHLYVFDSRIDDVVINDVIKEETRHEARVLIKGIMQSIKTPTAKSKGLNINDGEIVKTVSKIVEEMIENKDVMIQLIDIRTKDDYLFAHSVNCSIMATLVGTKMNYKATTLKCLATGALLHDLGMVVIPKHILEKQGALTEDERRTVENHPIYGYEIFKKTEAFNARAGSVILQHHERFHGQGYPWKLRGDKIAPLAQIAGVVDVYDALTSDRPFRKAYQPFQAVEMLMSWGEEYFDIDILQKFFSVVAAYPLGFHIFLNSGESGLVIANNPGFALRPVVRILYTGEDLAPHPAPYDLDLSQELDITITKVLN